MIASAIIGAMWHFVSTTMSVGEYWKDHNTNFTLYVSVLWVIKYALFLFAHTSIKILDYK